MRRTLVLAVLLLIAWWLYQAGPEDSNPPPAPPTAQEASPQVVEVQESQEPEEAAPSPSETLSTEPESTLLTGFVYLESDRTGVPGAVIEARWHRSKKRVRSKPTDSAGKFSISVASKRNVELRVLPFDGYVTATEAARRYVRLEHQKSELGPIRLFVTRGRLLEGTVVDRAGNPVAEAEICVSRWEIVETTQTSRDGTFSITLLESEHGSVYARAEDLGYSETELVSEAFLESPIELVLEHEFGEVLGIVRDSSGTAVAGARVHRRDAATNIEETQETESDGSFRFGPLEHHWEHHFSAAPPGLWGGAAVEATPEPGEQIELELIVPERGVHQITGRALQADGTPLPEVTVIAHGPNASPNHDRLQSYAYTTANPDGTFRFDSLPEGLYQLRAGGDAERDEPVEVRAGGDPVELLIRSKYTVFGTVIDAETRLPLASFSARSSYGDSTPINSPSGEFLVRRIHRGTESFVVQAKGYQGIEVDLTPFRDSETGNVDLGEVELDPFAPYTFRVIDPEGEPVPGVTIDDGDDLNGEKFRVGITNERGEFTFNDPYLFLEWIKFSKEGYCAEWSRYDLSDEDRLKEVTLSRVQDVNGILTFLGEPVAEAFLEFTPDINTAQTDSAGRFSLTPACDGLREIYLTGSIDGTGFLWEGKFWVQPFSVQPLELALPGGAASLRVRCLFPGYTEGHLILSQMGVPHHFSWNRPLDTPEFSGLKPGRYRLQARLRHGENSEQVHREVVIGEGENELDLVPGPGILRGRLIVPFEVTEERPVSISLIRDGPPTEDISERIRRLVGSRELTSAATFEWSGLEPDRYRVFASSLDEYGWEVTHEFQTTVQIVAAAPTILDVRLVEVEREEEDE